LSTLTYSLENLTSSADSATAQSATAKRADVVVSAANGSIADVPSADASREQSSAADSLTKAIEKAIEDLASAIDKAFCENSKNEPFLSIDKLSEFVKEERIRAVIGHCVFFHNMEDLVRFVQEDARRLFLTLVMMESKALEQELKYFQGMGFDDRVLPIGLDRDHSAYILGNPSSAVRYSLPSKWKRNERVTFEEYQRRFTIPVFGKPNNFHYHIPEGQRLPYLEVAPRPASSGYFGEVSKNIIHAQHIHPSIKLPVILWTSNKPTKDGIRMQIEGIAVAVKKTKEGDEDPQYSRAEFFDKEVGNLKRLREYDSPHLIKPISGYQIGQDRCLMFPWAEGGNLGGYWQDFPLQARNRSHVLWQLRQFVGICSALTELHNRNVRHGDLKPENILWFDPKNDGGTLQIADLGLATFHKKEADTRNRPGMPTQTPSGTSRYEPPEMDEKRNSPDPRSRQYDIWSLGCIVFELLLWLAYGPSGITIFRNNTPYFWQKRYQRGQNEYVVHEYVIAVMETLDHNFESGTAYKDLLNLVRNRLLVIRYSSNYEVVPDDCRESATKVHQCFAKIAQECESNEDYLKPLPEVLRYPEAELDGKAPQRNESQRNEVHEKDGKLAVPGKLSIAQPALDTSQTPADLAHINQSDISDPGPEIPRFALRKPTMDLNSGSLTSQTSQASNHHEVCLYLGPSYQRRLKTSH
jgi:serine/threonine protein kinase